MPLNETGLTLQATTLQTVLLFAQLHSGLAGMSGMDNIAVAGRRPVHWTMPTNGDFGLISQIAYTAGTPNAAVYSVTLWDAETNGTYYGEYPLTGDAAFNVFGEYQVTAIDFKGTASGA